MSGPHLGIAGCGAWILWRLLRLSRDERRPRFPSWRTEMAVAVLGVAQVVGFGILFLRFPVAYVRAVSEDQWVEWLTFHTYFGAGCLGVLGALVSWRRQRWAAVIGLVMALLCIGVAMEEISWGQRVFGFDTPAVLNVQNAQGEANFHNLLLGPGKAGATRLRKLAALGVLGYGVLLPSMLQSVGRAGLAVRFPIATPGAMPIFLAAVAALLARPRYRVDEIGEYLLGLGMLCVMATFCLGRWRPGRRATVVGVAWASVVVATLVMAPLGLGAEQGRVWRREIFQYYLYSFAIERFPLDGRWQDSRQLLEYAANHDLTNRQTHLWLARVAAQLTDHRAAAAYLRIAAANTGARLQQQPDEPFMLYTAGLVAREMRQSVRADSLERRAMAQVEESLRSQPQNDVLLTLLGHLCEDVGENARAEEIFAQATARDGGAREDFRYMLWTGREDEAAASGHF